MGRGLEGSALGGTLGVPHYPSDALCSRDSQLSSRTPKLTGASWLSGGTFLTSGETEAGDEMSLPQVA